MAPRPCYRPRCHNCRRRKVKCDYQRPACQRCLTAGLTCEGYNRDLTFVIFDTESASGASSSSNSSSNAAASKPASATTGSTPSRSSSSSSGKPRQNKAQQKQQQQQQQQQQQHQQQNGSQTTFALPSDSSSAVAATAVVDASISSTSFAQLGRHIAPTFASIASPFFLDIFSSSAGGARKLGHMSFLEGMLQETPENTPFQIVSRGFVRVCMANQAVASPLSEGERANIYQSCLAAVRQALVVPANHVRDPVLAAVWLLGVFELVNGSPPVTHDQGYRVVPERWSLQTQGLEALLKLRGPKSPDTGTESDMFWPLFMAVQSRYIILNERLPPVFEDWLQEIPSTAHIIPWAAARSSSEITAMSARIFHVVRYGSADEALELLQEINPAIEKGEQYFLAAVAAQQEPIVDLLRQDPFLTSAYGLYYASVLKVHHYTVLLCRLILSQHYASAISPLSLETVELVLAQRMASLSTMHTTSEDVLSHSNIVFGETRGMSPFIHERPDSPPSASTSTSFGVQYGSEWCSWACSMRLILPLTLTAQLPTSCPALGKVAKTHLQQVERLGIRQAHFAARRKQPPYDLSPEDVWASQTCSCPSRSPSSSPPSSDGSGPVTTISPQCVVSLV